ncbi:MAG TPA: PhzF family phenazine biosynthesis protein [Hypericibacter adhaerens]|uniref:PhzF family phenazine biosynthesis protein n=1 Tax=Hypericibacter adhaerens TaxID=2602016 RepID=UPI002BD2A641|nr:PhzF family phenazine biosynthesis protein [Hypericibacter adhaerens]HWA43951.1 PhzF family phenazine biosynthesis protein [Hypericibacter adhaerens]
MSMSQADRIPLYLVDAFAERAFAGNPAAVCVLPAWPPESLLLAIAAELNLSETAFVVGSKGTYEIRWFTPTREVDLIGHATLAAAHVVLGEVEPGLGEVRFRSGAETIAVTRDGENLAMDFPALRSSPARNPAPVGRALGIKPSAVLAAKHYMALYETADQVRALKPDMAALAALDLPAVMVTAPSDETGIDFVSRFFAPANGVPEDPVSGVAHLALVPYWSERLGKKRLVGRQLSQRGGIVIGLDRGARVTLMGRTVLLFAGAIHPEGVHLAG